MVTARQAYNVSKCLLNVSEKSTRDNIRHILIHVYNGCAAANEQKLVSTRRLYGDLTDTIIIVTGDNTGTTNT